MGEILDFLDFAKASPVYGIVLTGSVVVRIPWRQSACTADGVFCSLRNVNKIGDLLVV